MPHAKLLILGSVQWAVWTSQQNYSVSFTVFSWLLRWLDVEKADYKMLKEGKKLQEQTHRNIECIWLLPLLLF